MDRLLALPRAARRQLPGLGYGLALIACILLRLGALLPWGWTWFALLPALLGMAHLVAPREVRGDRLYRLLACLWLAAALFSALSHWHRLSLTSPWLGLASFASIAVAGTLYWFSYVIARPGFVRTISPRLRRVPMRVAAAFLLVAWVSCAVSMVALMCPAGLFDRPQPGTDLRRVWSVPSGKRAGWIAWSPDSRDLLVQVEGAVWLVSAKNATVRQVVSRGRISPDRPWLSSGDGFLYARTDGEGAGVYRSSLDGLAIRRLISAPEVAPPTCSPGGTQMAFNSRDGLWVANTDGSGRRLLARGGYFPIWSPDGTQLVFQQGDPWGSSSCSLWLTSPGGATRQLSVPVPPTSLLNQGLVWCGRDTIATLGYQVTMTSSAPVGEVRVALAGLDGRSRQTLSIASFPHLAPRALSAAPDGTRLAVSLRTDMPNFALPARLLVLDVATGAARRLPVYSDAVESMAWSPDGSSLAVVARPYDIGLGGRRSEGGSYVGIISGL